MAGNSLIRIRIFLFTRGKETVFFLISRGLVSLLEHEDKLSCYYYYYYYY